MRISARVENRESLHQATVNTDGRTQSLSIPPKPGGRGSSANGGELLFLALATCYCNDLYREAAKKGISVESVEVEVEGDFGAEGAPATNVTYKAKVTARGGTEEIEHLMRHTDAVAEIQNTLRTVTPVHMSAVEAVSLG